MTTHQNLMTETCRSARWRRKATPPAPFNVRERSIGNTAVLAWDACLRRALAGLAPGGRLPEIGCAQSRWLPCFDQELGLAVGGLDDAEVGVARARSILEAARVPGEIVRTATRTA